MPRCSSSAAVPGCPENPAALSRRSLLARVTVLGLALMPTASPAADDADAALLQLIRSAADLDRRAGDMAAKIEAAESADRAVSSADRRALRALDEAYRAASDAIIAFQPKSITSVRAILQFAKHDAFLDPDRMADMIEALLACQALAVEGDADV